MFYVEQFVQSVVALNTFVFDRAVRSYQRDILRQGSFSVISPGTGDRLVPSVCHVANIGDPAHGNIGIAYRLPCAPAIWLLAGSIKDGFPLTEAYQPAANVSVWSLGEVFSQENGAWKSQLRELEAGMNPAALPAVSADGGLLLLGHPNFAHNLWNELPALHAYSRSREIGPAQPGETLRVRAIYEPLLPVEQLVGDLAVSVSRVEDFQSLVGFQDAMATRLGSTRIAEELRTGIIPLLDECCDRDQTDAALASLAGCRPVVWLSARVDARTPDNQHELLWQLVHAIAAACPGAGFVLDGFSYPNDFDRPIYRQQAGVGFWSVLRKWVGADGFLGGAMKAREREIGAYTGRLRSSLQGSLPNPVVDVTGMRLASAITVAAVADYYVCHGGTLQHKIAWLHNTAGIVHCNTAGLQPGVPSWLADQLEDGRKPSLVSAQWVEDLDSIRAPNLVERNRDYHIVDVAAMVEEVVSELRACLSGAPVD